MPARLREMCCRLSAGMPSARMPSARMPSARMPSARMPSARMLSARMLSARMLSARMPSAGMPSARMLSARMLSARMLSARMLLLVALSGVVLLGQALLLSLALLRPGIAHAHPLAPIAVTVEQRGDELHAAVKRSRVQPRGAQLQPRFPRRCQPLGPPSLSEHAAYVIERYRLRCEGSLVGAAFAVDGLDEADVDAVVQVTLDDGRVVRGLLDRSADELVVSARAGATATLRSYGRAGLLHLLGGFDHLLYVLGLALLLRRQRRVLLALTAFTAGHGLSMCAAALGWVALSSQLAEAAIAATLVWLGYRLLRPASGARGITRPYLASLGVGLIHGLGFASAFNAAGLSGPELWEALGCFHIGIELGQLLVVLLALLAMQGLRRFQSWQSAKAQEPSSSAAARPLARVTVAAGYLIGSLSFMWLIERALQI